MNNFEKKFFKRYVPEWQEIKEVIHGHWIKVIWKLFFRTFWWAILPSFIYYQSFSIREFIPFYILEFFLIAVFIKLVYIIFDWYNDVWIVTNDWVIELDWRLFRTNVNNVNYWNIEWIEVDQKNIWDKILKKWDLIIHKIWEDSFQITDCARPYLAIDIIESVAEESEDAKEDSKFNMVMETLSWVVEDYLERKWLSSLPKNEIDELSKTKRINNDSEEIIKKCADDQDTIDLR